MLHRPSRFHRLFLALLIVTLIPIAAAAQVDKGVIEVAVVDDSGAAVPGVTVTLREPATGATSVDVTGVNGVARFAGLSPGNWTMKAELEGFAPVDQSGITLRVGQTSKLGVTLKPQASESITVEASSQIVDVFRSDTSSNIVPEQIEELPVADRDFQRLAFIAPGVQRERGGFRFIGGGPVIGSAGNASQSTIMVDGVDFTDQALGLARTRFSQDAIREFRVVQNRFDTEIGGSAGGALSIVTKSGTNEIAGTVFGFYRDDALREAGELEVDDLPYSRYQLGFTVGGPIVVDKTHFFASFEQVDTEDISLFRPGGAFVNQAADIDHPFNQSLAFGSLTHRISDRQNLAARFVYETYEEENFRVGGIADVSYGYTLERDNYNLAVEHNWAASGSTFNELRVQFGHREYFEPTNSDAVSEWFSSGTTLQIGSNITGDILGDGDIMELRDTYHFTFGGGTHNMKAGFSAAFLDETSDIPVYPSGLFIYVTDSRALPLAYAYGTGSARVDVDTTLYGLFVEDEWTVSNNLKVNLGLRWDYDSDGNNPDFTHPLVPEGRGTDSDNFQPRLGISWDVTGEGAIVARGGAGLFTGRYLLVPAFTELQQNGVTGRILQTRLNGALLGIPALALDPNNPTTTGIALKPDSTVMDTELDSPEATQFSLGVTTRIGDTGLYFDIDGIYVEGDNEITIRDVNWNGNANPTRPNASWNQINTYTNEGHSEYAALVLGLNGTIRGGHILTGSVTFADKKNISDDFSPEFPFGYPSDPHDIEAEWGSSRGTEDYRIVLSGVFRAPWAVTIAPIWEYGSGQPWNRRLGYDFNGDGKNSDRAAGVDRNSEDGESFSQFSLRLTKEFGIGDNNIDLIVEAFNLFDETNYDINSIDSAEFLGGPTLANPALPYRPNPNFGNYRATLPGREIQLGLRYAF
jgi:hypothetical protein